MIHLVKNTLVALGCCLGLSACDGNHPADQSISAQADWLTDFAQAKIQAQAENKHVLLDFTGSDWCPPCQALQRNVLSKPAFLDYARKNLVLVEVDFPQRKPQNTELKQHNQALAGQFDIKGYPTLILLDASGKVLMREEGYPGDTPQSLIAKINRHKQ